MYNYNLSESYRQFEQNKQNKQNKTKQNKQINKLMKTKLDKNKIEIFMEHQQFKKISNNTYKDKNNITITIKPDSELKQIVRLIKHHSYQKNK